jgi:hypothetical protein
MAKTYVLQILSCGKWTEWPAGSDLLWALEAFHWNKMNSKGIELVERDGWMIARAWRGKDEPLPKCQRPSLRKGFLDLPTPPKRPTKAYKEAERREKFLSLMRKVYGPDYQPPPGL